MFFLIKIIKIFIRLLKLVGKRQNALVNFIIYLNWKKRKDIFNLKFNNNNSYLSVKELKRKKIWPKKICANIVFFYRKNRIKFIYEICLELKKINKNTDITIITNISDKRKINFLKNSINKKCKIKVSFFTPKNLLDPRLLLFSHFEVVKNKIKNKNYSHFLFLEDDLLIKEKNIKYWINARKSLKPFNLIPVFLRTEKNYKNKEIYTVDPISRNKLSSRPRVISRNHNIGFVNLLDFFTPMYFYDRELMLEHLDGPSKSIDFGHGGFNQNLIHPTMIAMGVMERASTMLAFKDVPSGFLHRNVVPVDLEKNIVQDYCLIKHLSNKFTNSASSFGRIKVKDLFY